MPCYTIPCNNSTYILCHLSACVAFCPSTCPPCFPSLDSPSYSFQSLIIFSIWTAVRRPPGLLSRYEIHHVGLGPPPPANPPPAATRSTPSLSFTSSPVFSLVLYQVIGVLISGRRGCRVTDGPAGIMWSICIIGVLALFISLPVCLSRQHPCLRTYSRMCARTHSKDS